MKKETGRFLIDHSLSIGRDDAYITFGSDYKRLTKDTRDEYYSSKDPKYWVDCRILVEWLISGKSAVLEKCSNAKFQEWHMKERGTEYEVKWLSRDDVERILSHMNSSPNNRERQNTYEKEFAKIKAVVSDFFDQFSYESPSRRIQNYFFKSVGKGGIAGELQQFITFLSRVLASYRTLLSIQVQLHRQIDRMMKSRTDRERLRYQFGELIKVTYRKNDVLLKALCYKVDQLVRAVTYPDRLLKVIPFILCQLDIFPPSSTHKKRGCKSDRRKLCSNVGCYDRRFDDCNEDHFCKTYIPSREVSDGVRFLKHLRASKHDVKSLSENPAELERLYKNSGLSGGEKRTRSPRIMSFLKEYRAQKKNARLDCNENRKSLCVACTNREKSPFQNLCPQGAERFNYFVKAAMTTEVIKGISWGMQWLTENNLREGSYRCPFCDMKLFQYNFTRLHCLNCRSAFPFSARDHLHSFVGQQPAGEAGLPLKKPKS